MKKIFTSILIATTLASCTTTENDFFVNEDAATFAEVGSIDIGETGAAEISAYDPQTKRLFVVNNSSVNKIDVLDFADPSNIKVISSILVTPYGGYVNSVSVSNGKLAAAIESTDKQASGKVVVFNTTDYKEVKVITVGALPDMVTFSPDGKFILSANEGEPNASYNNDPVGSISIISVDENYAVTTLDFAGYEGQLSALKSKGFRVFGPNANTGVIISNIIKRGKNLFIMTTSFS